MDGILFAVGAITLLAGIFGVILGFASIRFKVQADPIVEKIDALLPQTQCGQCGYPGCRPYAQAIANGDAINKCPPGGQSTIAQLAELMGVDATDSAHDLSENIKKVAFIHEQDCIGCTNASKPVLSMRFRAVPKPCTPSFRVNVQDVIYVLRPAQRTVLK